MRLSEQLLTEAAECRALGLTTGALSAHVLTTTAKRVEGLEAEVDGMRAKLEAKDERLDRDAVVIAQLKMAAGLDGARFCRTCLVRHRSDDDNTQCERFDPIDVVATVLAYEELQRALRRRHPEDPDYIARLLRLFGDEQAALKGVSVESTAGPEPLDELDRNRLAALRKKVSLDGIADGYACTSVAEYQELRELEERE